MADSSLRLQDRTVLISGPFNGISQGLIRTMTEFGSDVAYINQETPNAAKYMDSINEMREVHTEYGRAAYFQLPMTSEKEIAEALGRVTESLGRVDIWMDVTPMTWHQITSSESIEQALNSCRALTERVLPFLVAKQKGRIIFVFEDECLQRLKLPMLSESLRNKLREIIERTASNQGGKNITINGLSLGITEDYILRHFAKTGSIRKALDEIKKTHPEAKLVESSEVGLNAAFLASAMSGSLTGQVLRLTNGFHL